jgi:hypothetical protein
MSVNWGGIASARRPPSLSRPSSPKRLYARREVLNWWMLGDDVRGRRREAYC